MNELIGLLIGYLIVSEREWIIATLLPPVESRVRTDNDPDWIHSVTTDLTAYNQILREQYSNLFQHELISMRTYLDALGLDEVSA